MELFGGWAGMDLEDLNIMVLFGEHTWFCRCVCVNVCTEQGCAIRLYDSFMELDLTILET